MIRSGYDCFYEASVFLVRPPTPFGTTSMEEEVKEEERENTTSMFEIICFDYGKDTEMEILDGIMTYKTMTSTTTLVLTTKKDMEGKVQRGCVYYLLRKQFLIEEFNQNTTN